MFEGVMSLSQMVMWKLVAMTTTVDSDRGGMEIEIMLTLSMTRLTNLKRTVARSREELVEESIGNCILLQASRTCLVPELWRARRYRRTSGRGA